jgi:hypothetical protein
MVTAGGSARGSSGPRGKQARQSDPGRYRPSWRICAVEPPPDMPQAYALLRG